jgi:hypothetical protein
MIELRSLAALRDDDLQYSSREPEGLVAKIANVSTPVREK